MEKVFGKSGANDKIGIVMPTGVIFCVKNSKDWSMQIIESFIKTSIGQKFSTNVARVMLFFCEFYGLRVRTITTVNKVRFHFTILVKLK